MSKQRIANIRHKADGSLCGKILRRNGKGKPYNAKPNEQQTHSGNVSVVGAGDAVVDDRRDDQRHDQIQRGLQQFKQRP